VHGRLGQPQLLGNGTEAVPGRMEPEHLPLVWTLVVVLAATALRVSEASGLRWSDLDFKRGEDKNSAWVHRRWRDRQAQVPCVTVTVYGRDA